MLQSGNSEPLIINCMVSFIRTQRLSFHCGKTDIIQIETNFDAQKYSTLNKGSFSPQQENNIQSILCPNKLKNLLIGMYPSWPKQYRNENTIFFLEFLYIWISMCSSLISNFTNWGLAPQGREWALFWVEKHCFSSLTPRLNFPYRWKKYYK